jgi:hypothetical protein
MCLKLQCPPEGGRNERARLFMKLIVRGSAEGHDMSCPYSNTIESWLFLLSSAEIPGSFGKIKIKAYFVRKHQPHRAA